MRLLIADGRQRSDHHVETVEPGPALDEVKPRGPRENDARERKPDQAKIVESFQGQLLGIGRWPLANQNSANVKNLCC